MPERDNILLKIWSEPDEIPHVNMNTAAELPLVPQRTDVNEWNITGMANMTGDEMPHFHQNQN